MNYICLFRQEENITPYQLCVQGISFGNIDALANDLRQVKIRAYEAQQHRSTTIIPLQPREYQQVIWAGAKTTLNKEGKTAYDYSYNLFMASHPDDQKTIEFIRNNFEDAMGTKKVNMKTSSVLTYLFQAFVAGKSLIWNVFLRNVYVQQKQNGLD